MLRYVRPLGPVRQTFAAPHAQPPPTKAALSLSPEPRPIRAVGYSATHYYEMPDPSDPSQDVYLQVRETEVQRLGPPDHDKPTRANQTQAGGQATTLKRRGQREKENRKQRLRGEGGRHRGKGEQGSTGESPRWLKGAFRRGCAMCWAPDGSPHADRADPEAGGRGA